jgi:ligand-binding sensor domain-containing protein
LGKRNNSGLIGGKMRQLLAKTIFLSAIIGIVISASLLAQVYPFREYSALDGLPQSQAKSIFQDSRGYIWIPTRNGLSRFDGIEFVNYTRKDGLISNEVSGVIEDSLGIIWTESSNSGLSKYDGIRFKSFPLENILDKTPVTGKYESNVIYYVAARPGKPNLRILRFCNGVYSDYSSQFKAFDTLSLVYVSLNREKDAFLVLDKFQNIWLWKDSVFSLVSKLKYNNVINEKGNIVFQKGSDLYEYLNGKLEARPITGYSGQVRAEYNYSNSGNEVTLFDGKVINSIELPFTPTRTFIDREGVLWFPSEKNIQRLVSTAFSSLNEIDLGTGNIWAIMEDNDGHLWFGSLYGDLVEYDGKSSRKRNDYKVTFGSQVAFFKGSRRMSDGEVWFSTDRGVLIWNGKKFSKLKSLPGNPQVCFIYEDPDEKKVMICTDKGLFTLKNNVMTCRSEFNDQNLGVIEGITKDHEGRYWLSGHKGIIVMDGDNLTYLNEEQFPHINSYTLATDRYDGIWVTSEEGLFFKEKSSDKFTMAFPETPSRPANSIILMDSLHIITGRVSDICVIDIEKY